MDTVETKLNNEASQPQRFKANLEDFKDKTIYATYINVTENELIQVLNQKRMLTFTLLSVNTGED